MWEAFELGPEDLLWAGIAFNGGIGAQQQAPCGAVSGSAISLGLLYRSPLADGEGAKQARQDARRDAAEVVRSFAQQFGVLTCRDLLGFDFSDKVANRKFQESGMSKEKCERYVQFAIEKLYELAAKRYAAAQKAQAHT